MGVTKIIDPIKYKLWFSRFLTADRTALPDVDIDFEYTNRDSVIHHLEDYYGKEYVSHIGTYTYMKVKSAIKDICRVLDISFTEANQISKIIDQLSDDPDLTFKKLDSLKEENPEAWKTFNELESKYKEIFRLARAFEGTPRNQGVHASGILVTPMPVSDLFPLRYDDEGTAITLYTGTQLEALGSAKLDILGLKTLSVIQKTLQAINPNISVQQFFESLDINDPKVMKYLTDGHTCLLYTSDAADEVQLV